jgi:MoaA/NifB/PqqE/SkfB family radical SAM enzyme
VVYYAAQKGFWVYVPTNARLLRPYVTDRLADAGVATFNFAVDVVDEKPGLPKARAPIRRYFEYLVRKQYRYGYTEFFNINICRTNMDDVFQRTEIAHEYGIATDYHINESAMIDHPQFQHDRENSTYITRDGWPQVDELVDWLIEKDRSGYKMVTSVKRLNGMREFLRRIETLELSGGSELNDHPGGWFPDAVLSPVFGHLRLGHGGRPSIRGESTR